MADAQEARPSAEAVHTFWLWLHRRDLEKQRQAQQRAAVEAAATRDRSDAAQAS